MVIDASRPPTEHHLSRGPGAQAPSAALQGLGKPRLGGPRTPPSAVLGNWPSNRRAGPSRQGRPWPGKGLCRLVWCLHGHIFRVLSTRPIHVLVSSSHVFMRRSKSAPVPATTAIAGIATTTIRATDTLSFPEAAAAPAQPSRA